MSATCALQPGIKCVQPANAAMAVAATSIVVAVQQRPVVRDAMFLIANTHTHTLSIYLYFIVRNTIYIHTLNFNNTIGLSRRNGER